MFKSDRMFRYKSVLTSWRSVGSVTKPEGNERRIRENLDPTIKAIIGLQPFPRAKPPPAGRANGGSANENSADIELQSPHFPRVLSQTSHSREGVV